MKRIVLIVILINLNLYSSEFVLEMSKLYKDREYLMIIDNLENEEELTEELTFYLAESYLYSIKDPKTWMKYNSKYQSTIVKCLSNDPENVNFLLNSARGMMWFPSSRGGLDDGVALLKELELKFSDNPDVIYAISNYRYGEGLIEEAKSGYRRVLEIDPDFRGAKETLDSIYLDEKNLEISNLTFNGNSKTSSKRLYRKIGEYKGQKLNKGTRAFISRELMEIPSINSAIVKGVQKGEFVELEIDVKEESSRILMLQQVSGAGLDSNNDIFPSGLMPPISVYIDNNFLGSGANLMFITVFVYNQLKITYPGLIDDKYLDLKFDITSMLLSSEDSTIHNGVVKDGNKKNSYHKGQVGLGRTFPFNLSLFAYYHANFEIHEKLRDNITPNHLLTHSASGEIIFNSAGSSDTPFSLLEGVYFKAVPKLNYKQNYKSWGDPDNLTTHNSSPSLTLITQAGWYKNLNPKSNLSIQGSWFINSNPYSDDIFKLGHRGDAITNESITGYLPGEIIFNNGTLVNLKYTYTPRANKFNIYSKYDFVVDIENGEAYNGVGIGGAVKLPKDIDLKSEFGVALNAIRDSGPGFFLSLEISKLMIF